MVEALLQNQVAIEVSESGDSVRASIGGLPGSASSANLERAFGF